MKQFYTSILILLIASGNVFGQTITTCNLVKSSSDDVEQQANNGIMYLASSDIELVNDPDIASGNQTVGLRFTNINVPKGATVSNAYIQFTADEPNSGFTLLTIRGEDVDNSPPFTSSPYNVSSRIKTSASKSWKPFSWVNPGDAGSAQRTPNVSNIIQEIINRPGYNQLNAISIIITGSGERTAKSYDGSPSQAPQLCISYTVPQTCLNTAPAGSISNLTHNSVTLNWTSVPGAVGYRITGAISGQGTITLDVPSWFSSFTVGGLTPGTSYLWIVQGKCNGAGTSLSPASNVGSFTTINNCGPPASLFTNLLTSTSVRLNWSTVPGALGYRISGNAINAPGEVVFDLIGGSNSFTDVSGLSPSTSFYWRIQTICAGTLLSGYSPFNTFSTPAFKMSETSSDPFASIAEFVNIYPNPATDAIFMDIEGVEMEESVDLVIFNSTGVQVSKNTFQYREGGVQMLLPAHLSAGIYHLQVEVGKKRIMKKMVIR